MSEKCPTCGGSGEIAKNVETMTNLELVIKAHEIAFENDKFPSSLVALLYELKGRIEQEDLEDEDNP